MLLVGVLSLSFIVLAVLTTESLGVLIKGILHPKFPDKDPLIIAALIGTTVVPYNLFLHSSLARQKWKFRKGIKSMRIDTFFAVALGVLVSISIIITTANISDDLTNVNNLKTALEPVLGPFSAYLMGIGFIAAGLTSAITAPLAAAFVINELFGLNYETRSFAFKRLSYVILIIGCLVAALDLEPVQVIKLAQVANAIILPVIVIIILWLDRQIGQQSRVRPFYQLLGLVVLLISVFLSLSSLYKIIDL
jgi:Mn2+/Fe2+ NRAMP family transporter